MRILLFIFFGGGLGSVCRYLVHRVITLSTNSVMPYGTFLVNMIGCFLIGFLVFATERMGSNALNWRLFLVTGFCGGFTTFSSFSFENVELINNHQIFYILIYTLGSVCIGILATYVGIILARNI